MPRKIDFKNGKMALTALAVLVLMASAASGSGVIASVYFDAIEAGSSEVKIINMLLADKDGNRIGAITHPLMKYRLGEARLSAMLEI